jgi:predicted metal-dependent phosphoesterase TrpH
MTGEYVDLHIHTNASDGLLMPREVIKTAAEKGLAAISITDHDTTDGFTQALGGAKDNGIELIPGVELSCLYMDSDVHLLGYYFNHKDSAFIKIIRKFREERYKRGEAMVAKLNDLGINLSMETVKTIAGEASVGRPHLAEALVKEEYVQTFDEAFARYLGYHASAYVPKKHFDVDHAIDLLHRIGGVAVLAHPGTLKHDEFIPDFVDMGLDGLEAYHSMHKRPMVNHYKNMAKKYNLLYTGGSDCHGPRKGRVLIGTVKVPYVCVERMKKAVEKL